MFIYGRKKPTKRQWNIATVLLCLAVFSVGILPVAEAHGESWWRLALLVSLGCVVYTVHILTRMFAPVVSFVAVAMLASLGLQLGAYADVNGQLPFLWFFAVFSFFFFSLFVSLLFPSEYNDWWLSLSATFAGFVGVLLGSATGSPVVAVCIGFILLCAFLTASEVAVTVLKRRGTEVVQLSSEEDAQQLEDILLAECAEHDCYSMNTYSKDPACQVTVTSDAPDTDTPPRRFSSLFKRNTVRSSVFVFYPVTVSSSLESKEKRHSYKLYEYMKKKPLNSFFSRLYSRSVRHGLPMRPSMIFFVDMSDTVSSVAMKVSVKHRGQTGVAWVIPLKMLKRRGVEEVVTNATF